MIVDIPYVLVEMTATNLFDLNLLVELLLIAVNLSECKLLSLGTAAVAFVDCFVDMSYLLVLFR